MATATANGLNAALIKVYPHSFVFFSSPLMEEYKTPSILSTLQPQQSPVLGTAHLRESENTHAHALGKYKRVEEGGGGIFCFRLEGEGAGKIQGGGSGEARERGKEREARTTLPDR